MVPKVASSVLRDENCNGQACGICNTCRRQASAAIVAYVIRKRYTERGRKWENCSDAEDRRYVRNTVMRMLDVAGLLDKNEMDIEQIKLLDWGRAMRSRQLGR